MKQSFMMRPTVQLVMAVLLFLSVTIVADRYLRGTRVDLTEDNLYTLSSGTHQLLLGLEEPVSISFYFSKSQATPYPQLLSYGKRVEDMLRAFSAASGGNIELSIVDPEPFSEAEDEAVAAGLRGVPLGDGSMLYMGLMVTDALDGEATIPFFTEEREKFLEYDLVKLIATLDSSEQKQLTILTSLPMQFGPGGPQAMMQGRGQPYVLYQQLGDFFKVEDLAADFTEIPSETDVLMVVHPPTLSDDQLFVLEQYVLKGGRALVFLDPHAEAMNPRATAPSSSGLGPLLNAWGVSMPEGKVVGDASLAMHVQMGGYGPDSIKDYVFWLSIRSDFLTKDDIATGSVDLLNIASAGILEPVDGATTTFTPLVSTSAAAMLYDASRAVGQPDPDVLLRDLQPTGESYALAARISGPAKTAFPERVQKEGGPVENPAVAEGKINIVLGSDSDMFEDRFWVQLQELLGQRIVVPLAGNGSFILNLADHISGSEALLNLRGRGISKRPFDVVDSLRRDAEAKYLSEEKLLQDELSALEMRIAEVEGQAPEEGAVLSSEAEAEIERFRTQMLETRKALREVKRGLRAEIDRLGKWLAFLNIALVPLLIIVLVLLRLYLRGRASRAS